MKFKIPMPPTFELVEFDDASPSEADLLESQRMHAESEKIFIEIYQVRLLGLGYDGSLEHAAAVYKDETLRTKIDDEWFQLERRHLLNDMISGIENVARQRGWRI